MAASPSPIGIVARLVELLDEEHVSYCHWKSNAEIAKSVTGENDLDLLVARRDAGRFREALARAGFARAERPVQPQPAGKEDYFGYDSESGALVHVDAHYRLILGHDRTKNYCLPLEDAFLESAQSHDLLRVPSPELEYVVFLTRMTLKYAVWDEVLWQGLRGRRAGLTTSESNELAYLESAIDAERVEAVVRDWAPWLEGNVLNDAAAAARDMLSLPRRLELGRRMHTRLAAYAETHEAVDGIVRLARRMHLAARRRLGGPPGFRLANGGAIVGLIGGDGSGKSTAVDGIVTWLGNEFDVRQIHLGRPRWSLTTKTVRGGFRLATMIRRTTALGRDAASNDHQPRFRAMAWLACTARDRYITYRRARRFADRGGIVISDRYPHSALRSMDIPLIESLDDSDVDGKLGVRLHRLEHMYHERIRQPEVLIVLKVDPEIAARRKTTEPSDYVRRRAAEVSDVDWEEASVPVIDGSRSVDAVASELRAMIWEALG